MSVASSARRHTPRRASPGKRCIIGKTDFVAADDYDLAMLVEQRAPASLGAAGRAVGGHRDDPGGKAEQHHSAIINAVSSAHTITNAPMIFQVLIPALTIVMRGADKEDRAAA